MNNKLLISLFLLIALTSCGVHQSLPTDSAWKTARVTNASVTAQWDEKRVQIGCNLYAIRDSIFILTAMPMPGVEVARIEVRPQEIKIIDKMNRRYIVVGWKEFGQLIGHKLHWKNMERLLIPTTPLAATSLHRQYSLQDHTLVIELQYGNLKWDEPITIRPIHTDAYQPMTLSDLLVLL